jgi:hemoglobin
MGVALAIAIILHPACHSAPSPGASATPAPTPTALYQRLGGYEAIAAVTDDFLARMLGDPKMVPYFEQLDQKGKQRVRQMIVDQLCALTGGPCVYVGADMPTAHKGLHITETAFTVAARYLGQSLDHFKVAQKEKTELLTIVAGTKNDIVNR